MSTKWIMKSINADLTNGGAWKPKNLIDGVQTNLLNTRNVANMQF